MPYGRAPIYVDALGPLQVRRGPQVVDLGPAKQRAVFAALALHAGEVVLITPLIDELWGRSPPFSARHLVHTYVARLRQVLEPEMPRRHRVNVIGSTPNGYRLLIDREQVDLTRFHQLRTQANHQLATGDRVRAFGLLGEAVRLWRDPSLRDLSGLLPHSDEVDTIRQAWVDAALEYVTLGLELGEASTVWPLAEQLAKAEPMHEEAQARYLVALNRTGRRAAAIEHYSDIRARLSNELGVDPGPQLADAYRHVLLGGERETVERAPVVINNMQPARPPWRGPGPGLGELIHRDEELAAITECLSGHRLVTLAGPPGCGKSALALHAAARLRDSFLGGVIAADCSDVTDVTGLNWRLLDLLPGALEVDDVPAVIGGQQILIVLDNVEHLVDPCAALVDEVVRSCRQVSVLVTSREPLGLPDEMVWRVRALAVPDLEVDGWAEIASVKLFIRRVSQVRPEFQLVPEKATAVATICRRLDGLPLALEMAAASLATDSLDGLLRRLDGSLREIHPLRRGRPSHHHSLWTALLHSAKCLTELERWCFVRLSDLPEDFTLAQAREVCTSDDYLVDVEMVLSRLVDKSLLFVQHGPDGPRYRMLGLIHRFAAELAAVEPV